jgi:hypothetical protein
MCTSQDALAAIGELRSPSLGVVIDTGHLNLSGEDTERVIQNLGDHLVQVHVNDNDGKQQQNAIPGEGTYDFPRLIRLLRTVGYTGLLSSSWDGLTIHTGGEGCCSGCRESKYESCNNDCQVVCETCSGRHAHKKLTTPEQTSGTSQTGCSSPTPTTG